MCDTGTLAIPRIKNINKVSLSEKFTIIDFDEADMRIYLPESDIHRGIAKKKSFCLLS